MDLGLLVSNFLYFLTKLSARHTIVVEYYGLMFLFSYRTNANGILELHLKSGYVSACIKSKH